MSTEAIKQQTVKRAQDGPGEARSRVFSSWGCSAESASDPRVTIGVGVGRW